eukprot:5939773-Pleurochrysis_carterae.AAC.2
MEKFTLIQLSPLRVEDLRIRILNPHSGPEPELSSSQNLVCEYLLRSIAKHKLLLPSSQRPGRNGTNPSCH